MNSSSHTTSGEAEDEPAASSVPDQGWYLYGITEFVPGGTEPDATPHMKGIEDHEVTREVIGSLTAVVSPVSLGDYSPQSLADHATNIGWLEAIVRRHNDVIDSIHAAQPILPAKFGSVYANTDDLRRALEPVQTALQNQLDGIRETDEWAVHVYADRTVVEGEVAERDQDIQDLKSQLTDARPGRAFFLQRKLSDELSSATEAALTRLAQDIHDRLAAQAADNSLNSPAPASQRQPDRVEILRAAYLVPRERTQLFLDEVRNAGDERAGVVVEPTGPWPPYSFVSSVAGEIT